MKLLNSALAYTNISLCDIVNVIKINVTFTNSIVKLCKFLEYFVKLKIKNER